jgi:CRP-like cAMP-binding protein
MTQPRNADTDPACVLMRLRGLAPLSSTAQSALVEAMARPRNFLARQEIERAGDPAGEPRAIASGWACRMRGFSDGRRQILSLLLPGDLIGLGRQRAPLARSTILALTPVMVGAVPRPDMPGAEDLADAYAISEALDEAYLLAQIGRVGRMTAYERVAELMMELHARLGRAGLAEGSSFAMPLTQEMLADMLGLTSVHVNRTLRSLRHDGLMTIHGGMVTIHDMDRLAAQIGYQPPAISPLRP